MTMIMTTHKDKDKDKDKKEANDMTNDDDQLALTVSSMSYAT